MTQLLDSSAEGRASSVPPPSTLRRLVHENSLSLALVALFALSLLGQVLMGWAAHDQERREWGLHALELSDYLASGHFIEALFENWESEFLQMGLFVWLAARLVQKGSAESNPLDEPAESAADPRQHRSEPDVPWPVRRGGWVLWLYERSLLFAFSLLLHAVGGLMAENEERLAHGEPPQELAQFVSSSQFWFQSFQNWQSEFVAILCIVLLTICLRQRGSPQSKPVAATHARTGH